MYFKLWWKGQPQADTQTDMLIWPMTQYALTVLYTFMYSTMNWFENALFIVTSEKLTHQLQVLGGEWAHFCSLTTHSGKSYPNVISCGVVFDYNI